MRFFENQARSEPKFFFVKILKRKGNKALVVISNKLKTNFAGLGMCPAVRQLYQADISRSIHNALIFSPVGLYLIAGPMFSTPVLEYLGFSTQ